MEKKTATYIISPKTGKKITVNGPAYKALQQEPLYKGRLKFAKRFKGPAPGTKKQRVAQPTSKVKESVALGKASPQSLRKTLETLPETRKAKIRDLKEQIEKKGEGRGAPTRGWGAAKPQKGKERHKLMHECGAPCFLLPETEGFPICAALREKQGCKVDCRGVLAAKIRARQWKYPNVAAKAEKIGRKLDCEWV